MVGMTSLDRSPEVYVAEVFGFPSDNRDADVTRFRSLRLCPFRPLHPKARRDLSVPDHEIPFEQQFGLCTKGKKNDPLGVCSVYVNGRPCITCPVRFGEGRVMLDAAAVWAASVLGVPAADMVAIPEVRLIPTLAPEGSTPSVSGLPLDEKTSEISKNESSDGDSLAESAQGSTAGDEQNGSQEKSAGNIDYVLAHIDTTVVGSRYLSDYHVNAYAALEVQAVYISGNVRNPFEAYMGRASWDGSNPPRPDWLSSSRKRLVPQLAWKGSVLHAWMKPIAVCVQAAFWDTMPYLSSVTTSDTASAAYQEMAWVITDLERQGRIYRLRHIQTLYSEFEKTLLAATQTPAGYDHILRKTILTKYIRQTTGKSLSPPKKSKPLGMTRQTKPTRQTQKSKD
ncbi:NotI family restriction endonuclease [Deinococcus murrayi]|uniref:NotI family restriction endonuclease n=1 Tax=Deinococcus murrayi TaxID=68910 RepID=UPI000A0195FD|nr:NotI family restriction endonuclease [Deinococcus murrayi]